MNRNKLKTYAPKARRAFIQAATARASKFGITVSKIEPVQIQGDVALIGGQAFPRKVAEQRRKLEERIALRGFDQVMEEAAYTWFNRFAAIRFMEVHGYLDHGYRVLSHPEGKATPEIIEHAEHLDLPGLYREEVIDLKLDGTKDEELYRMLLTAQCNALHTAMPFLFERIDDETELLLPDNLLHSDSLIRQMVSQIDEFDWQDIEIIGWLYQFYISEKKDEVIGKVVKTEDIPAATQLFTPNWIVKYMVQNSLGAKWLATYPQSSILSKMEYYIVPEKQKDAVEDALADITPAELNPEDITFLDPACGSGHILVEAYDLFKEIYLERGYSPREIPKLILERNLYGLDIDKRAAQMAGFAVLMKARNDDKRIFQKSTRLNIQSIVSSRGINAKVLARLPFKDRRVEIAPPSDLFPNTLAQLTLSSPISSAPSEVSEAEVIEILKLFEDADAFGSLIEVPPQLARKIGSIEAIFNGSKRGDIFDNNTIEEIFPVFSQARILGSQFDITVTNPPYMGSRYYSPRLKNFVSQQYKESKADLCGCFMQRAISLTRNGGIFSQINIPNWMFISSFEELRDLLGKHSYFKDFIHNGRGVFGSDFGSCAFTVVCHPIAEYKGKFRRLFDRNSEVSSNDEIASRFHSGREFIISGQSLESLPGKPLAYWVSDAVLEIFRNEPSVTIAADARQGLATADNNRFVRVWHELPISQIAFDVRSEEEAKLTGKRWFPYNKGGEYRKWYGNISFVVDWENNGERIKNFKDSKGKLLSAPRNCDAYFRPSISWSDVTISDTAFRHYPNGFIFDGSAHSSFYASEQCLWQMLAYLNTKFVNDMVKILNPSVHFQVGSFKRLPYPSKYMGQEVARIAQEAWKIAKEDWDSFETSWGFRQNPLLNPTTRRKTISMSFEGRVGVAKQRFDRMRELEQDNNARIITAYGLQTELSPEVSDNRITLATPGQEDEVRHLLSYAIGCMMGRYSLVEPGLIYASSGNAGFDASRYGDFPADDDGIIPVTEAEWFSDDAANRFAEFLKVAWSPETVKENLKFVADSLGAKTNETPMDTIRRYLSRDFYKDHLKTYKKRPIYWLFSSGKEKAFECLVYLHRYTEGTLSRMRMEYVTPLQGQVAGKIDRLEEDIRSASSTAKQSTLRKQLEKLKKQQAELIKFDEELRHYADKRIKLDLDDGVKVNYGKFGNLLAEVKTVTGGTDE